MHTTMRTAPARQQLAAFFAARMKAPTENLDALELTTPEKELLQKLQREYGRFTDMRPGIEKAELLDALRGLKRSLDAVRTTEAAQVQAFGWQTLLY